MFSSKLEHFQISRVEPSRIKGVLGRACLEDILNHVDKDGHRLCGEEYCPLQRAMVTGVTTSVPVIVFALCKDGTRVPTLVTTAPIRNEAGEVIGGVETFRDVSPMRVDLERAQKIQHQALQYDLPEDPRLRFSTFFRSHDIVGADYYAIQALDEDRYGFLLADMEGHGVAAALYAMHSSILWNRHFHLLKNLNYPKTPLGMDTLEEELLKFSNDIRLQDDVTIIEARFSG